MTNKSISLSFPAVFFATEPNIKTNSAVQSANACFKTKVAELTIGTPVAVAEKNGDYYLVEGKGHRGWIHKQYLTLEGADTDGQTVDQGE